MLRYIWWPKSSVVDTNRIIHLIWIVPRGTPSKLIRKVEVRLFSAIQVVVPLLDHQGWSVLCVSSVNPFRPMSLISVIRRITAHSTGPKRRRMPALCLFSTLLSSIALTRSREYLLQRLIKENSHRHSGCWGTFAGQQRSITHFIELLLRRGRTHLQQSNACSSKNQKNQEPKTKNIPAN